VRITGFAVLSITLMLAGCDTSTSNNHFVNDEVSETVIGLVADGLERLRTGDPRGITNACAEDVTYYSVEFDSLLVGRQTLEEMYGPPTGQTYYDHFVLVNPTVQVLGSTAVLAFDFASYTTADDSQLRTRWRSTQVLTRTDADWRIVHIHWTLLETKLE
jgi:hypothetical protein